MQNEPLSGNDDSRESNSPQFSPQQKHQARQLLRARTRLIVCFWTLPIYVIGVWLLLSNQRGVDAFMFIYMGMWGGFAIDMVRRACPHCHRQFFVKNILMNLRTKSCVHCGFDSIQAQQAPTKDQVTF